MSIVIQRVFRAYTGADTPLKAWIRDEAGAKDLSEAEIAVRIKRVGGCEVVSLDAVGSEAGGVTFTVTADDARRIGGMSGLEIVADGEVVGLGILEVLP